MIFHKVISVKGTRTSCVTSEEEAVELGVEIVGALDQPALQIRGGPTGWEGYSLDPECVERSVGAYEEGKPWLACMGTEGRWDTLEISSEEMLRVYEELGIFRRG